MSLLQVKDLKVHFPVPQPLLEKIQFWNHNEKRMVKAVDGVSFSIEQGETLGLVGESGCGKSTTARTILGLIRATGGSVALNGEELLNQSKANFRKKRSQIQMVFQNPFSALNPRLTVREILEEPLRSLLNQDRATRMKRVMELMEIVQLDRRFLDRYPHEFSGGQRQRINIARALAVKPRLVVLDEPVSALDVSIQAQIINLLQDLQKEFQLSYLFIAHDLSVVKTLSHRVAVMYLGRIVEIHQTDKLYLAPQHPYTQALLSAVPVPDPKQEKARVRIPLEGEIPSPIDVPAGCPFHPRCHKAADICLREVPSLEKKQNGAAASCLRVA